MQYILQKQLENLKGFSKPNKAVIILGPRRCGKTTLIKKFLETRKEKYLFVNGEDLTVKKHLSSQSINKLQNFIGKSKLLIIDEAQKINDIGLNIKLIVDHIEGIKVIATGSSAFDLAKNIGEPLTGRKITLKLFPISQLELNKVESFVDIESNLESRLIYGSYPEVILSKGNKEKEEYLKEIIGSYLYKDLLEFEGIKHSDKLVKLLQLLAFQIGKQISYNELGTQLGISKNTAEKYLDLLEKTFVVYKISAYSRNKRKEISTNPRYNFFDNGIRNALINNFNSIDIRNDIGMLWENYVITERMKRQEYKRISSNNYFWRTYQGQEIDLVEERNGKLYGYEIKWNEKKSKAPSDWKYEEAVYEVINKENYLKFIC